MTRVDIDHPASFKEGIRVLLLMLRAKDGGSAKTDRRATKKVITTSVEEFDAALSELRALHQPNQRIYSTIDPRDLQKAIRSFQFRMLEAQWFDEENRNNFYLDLENRWISCLKDPKSGRGHLFLFDLDEDSADFESVYEEITNRKQGLFTPVVVDDYKTRNGRHLITMPFNPALVSNAARDCKHSNALMLWSY